MQSLHDGFEDLLDALPFFGAGQNRGVAVEPDDLLELPNEEGIDGSCAVDLFGRDADAERIAQIEKPLAQGNANDLEKRGAELFLSWRRKIGTRRSRAQRRESVLVRDGPHLLGDLAIVHAIEQ